MAEIAPGTRLSLWWPAAAVLAAFGAASLAPAVGSGFTVNVSDDQYRAVLRSAVAGADGVTMEFEITGLYDEPPSDEDWIRGAMAEAKDHPGRVVTR